MQLISSLIELVFDRLIWTRNVREEDQRKSQWQKVSSYNKQERVRAFKITLPKSQRNHCLKKRKIRTQNKLLKRLPDLPLPNLNLFFHAPTHPPGLGVWVIIGRKNAICKFELVIFIIFSMIFNGFWRTDFLTKWAIS
jgi:hypothetical protein